MTLNQPKKVHKTKIAKNPPFFLSWSLHEDRPMENLHQTHLLRSQRGGAVIRQAQDLNSQRFASRRAFHQVFVGKSWVSKIQNLFFEVALMFWCRFKWHFNTGRTLMAQQIISDFDDRGTAISPITLPAGSSFTLTLEPSFKTRTSRTPWRNGNGSCLET